MSSNIFEDPADFTGIDYSGLMGCLLMFNVKLIEEHIQTSFTLPGEKTPAVRVDLTILDGHQAGSVLTDALVFPKQLFSQLRPKVGKLVLGRLEQGEAKEGRNAPWRLAPATAQEKATAEAFLNRARITTPASPTSQAPF